MITVKETIIVEGEYDKITLSEVLDANIVTTSGFRIFKDKEMQNLIKKLAQKDGVIIFTDSDRAGFLIRNFLKNVSQGERVLHAYIPEIKGKEKRKSAPGKEGLLGVEGVSREILLDAILKSGATTADGSINRENPITKVDLYKAGLYGTENSKEKRCLFLQKLGLPQRLSANMLIDVLNVLYKKEELDIF